MNVDDCDVIICYGGAKPTDRHLAATVHCVDDEIIEWLEQRREQRRGCVATLHQCRRPKERLAKPCIKRLIIRTTSR
jgi:hypothetical protein